MKIEVVVTPEEKQIIAVYAKANGRSMSEFLRHFALKEAKRHTPVEGLSEMIHKLVLKSMWQNIPGLGDAIAEYLQIKADNRGKVPEKPKDGLPTTGNAK